MKARITVKTYAGYKGDERPTSFLLADRVLQVVQILDRWYDPDYNYYKALSDDGKIYLLQQDLNADIWTLVDEKNVADDGTE